jgi:hypothetical protein
MTLPIKPPTHLIDADGVFVHDEDTAWDHERVKRECLLLEMATLAKLREDAVSKATAAAQGRELSEEEIEGVKASCTLTEFEVALMWRLHPYYRYINGETRYQLDAPDHDLTGKPATAREYLKSAPTNEFVIRRLGYRTLLDCSTEMGPWRMNHNEKMIDVGTNRMIALVRHGVRSVRSAEYSWTAKGSETTPEEVLEALPKVSISLTKDLAMAVQRFNAPLSEDEKSRAA